MPDVRFSEEEAFKAAMTKPANPASDTGGLHKALIRIGLAKDQTGANIILIIIAVLFIAASAIIFMMAA